MNWDLSKLYQSFDDPKLACDVQRAEDLMDGMLVDIGGMDGTVLTAEQLADLIERRSEASELLICVSSYAQLTLAVDANCEPARACYDRVIALMMRSEQLDSALARLTAQVKDMDALAEANPVVRTHRFALDTWRDRAAHTIDPALEPLALKMQLTGGRSWEQLRDQLDANLLIPFEQDGKTEQLPLSAIRGLANSPDADVRKRAYEAELGAYPRIEIPMAACLNGIKGEALTLAELRHFDSVLDTALYESRMDRATLDALLGAMRDSLPMFRRYFRLKARLLGYEGGLKFCDLFAPVGSVAMRYTLEEARAMLVETFSRFNPKVAQFMDHAFEDHWIDVYPRPGKQGGAFDNGVHPLKMSYVMTNFDGSYSSVSTLAHELGHAWHDAQVADSPVLLSYYPMPLAETASIFNETMLMEKTLETADDAAKITLLEQQLGDAAQVIVDIMSRYLFETEVIERRKTHALSARELCGIMTDAQKQTYGDGLDPAYMHPYMWACKSHYYSADLHFYNFPYAFGQLFGLGIYQIYLEKGSAFAEDYNRLLKSTGCGDVRTVAASVGIDVASKDFWMKSIDLLAGKLDQLEALCAK